MGLLVSTGFPGGFRGCLFLPRFAVVCLQPARALRPVRMPRQRLIYSGRAANGRLRIPHYHQQTVCIIARIRTRNGVVHKHGVCPDILLCGMGQNP